MPYSQYRSGSTYYGYDPQTQQGIAFSNPQSFNKYFGNFDANAPAPTFDTSKLMASPDQLISLAPPAPTPTPQAQPQTQPQSTPARPTYTPTPYTPPQVDTSQLQQYENQYRQALVPSAEENQAQADVNAIDAATGLSVAQYQNAPMNRMLAEGQQAALARQGAALQVPLVQRLALAQAKRQASLEASKFALEREDDRVKQLKEESRYKYEQNESTNRFAFSSKLDAYDKELALQQQKEQQQYERERDTQKFNLENHITQPYYTIGNTIYSSRTDKPAYENVNGEIRSLSDGTRFSNPQQFFTHAGINSWNQIQNNIVTQNDREYDLAKAKFTFDKESELFGRQKTRLEMQKLQSEINGRGDLLPTEKDRAAFNQIVNQYNKSPLIAASDRTIVLKNTVDSVKQDPSNAAKQLNLAYGYIQALDTYQSAVREGELANVNTIDSKIGQLQNYVQQMTSGQTVRPEIALQIANAAQNLVDYISAGARQKEEVFRSQARVNGIEGAWNSFRGGFSTNYDSGSDVTLEQLIGQMPEARRAYERMKAEGLPRDVIEEAFGLKKKVSSTDEVNKIAESIGSYESGGRYDAIGPVTKNGDRAYGKYQVMGANIPSWTKQALGYSLTPQQFLKDKQAQDKVARYKMAILYNQYGTLEDVASVWFSGRPASGNNARDVIGTSVPKYISGIRSIYNKLS